MPQDKNAANDGELLKHSLLAEVLSHCSEWHSLTYAETHAGAGIYEARKQAGGRPHIENLQVKIADIPESSERQGGSRFTRFLKDWWSESHHNGLYPGSVLQAAMLLTKIGKCNVEFRVTEHNDETCADLESALAEFGVTPACSGFQFKLDWITQNDSLVLVIDPFTYADDSSGLALGRIDLDTLLGILNSCWRKQACLIGFWCAAPHQKKVLQSVFDESLKSAAANNSAAARSFWFGQCSMFWIGIGYGIPIVNALPETQGWMEWLRRVMKEDLAMRHDPGLLPLLPRNGATMSAHATESQVVWFDIPCLDLDRAIRFYNSVLNCEVQKHEGPGFALGVLPHEGQAIGGCLVTGMGDQPSDHGVLIYLNCDGRLDDAVAAVIPQGGTVVTPAHSIAPHGRRAIVLDSEGNRVALHSR
ncbi:MAG: hypothetical protein JNG89_06960 [Planctomycetaceae bacterium]|nr:hypothetical protein [Planctomycetaceae bacterium]